MPCFFFNARSPRAYVPDRHGFLLKDYQAARDMAMRTALSFESAQSQLPDWKDWVFEIAVENERVSVRMPFWRGQKN